MRTRLFDIAANRHKIADGLRPMHGRRGAGVEYETPLNRTAVSVGVQTGGSNDVFNRNGGNGGCPFRSELLHMLFQLVVVGAPILNELMINQILVHNDVQPRERNAAVCTRMRTQPIFRASTPPGEDRVDGDDLRAHLNAHVEPMAEITVTVALKRLVAPHDKDVWTDPLVVGVTVGQRFGRVDNRIVAERPRCAADSRHVAPPTGEVNAADVRSPKARASDERNLPVNIAAGTVANENRLAAKTLIIDFLFDVFFDDVESLIPCDALPFVLTALPRTLHGILQALRMIDHLLKVEATHAKLAVRIGIERVAFNLLELAVFRVKKNAA